MGEGGMGEGEMGDDRLCGGSAMESICLLSHDPLHCLLFKVFTF